ncbi:MAG TPA: protein kinase [Terriglobales bacterium]|nr:protein kinase [Terriglobales bacterium]
MALAGGARLGPYEIESPVGAGGMGEVYRARDTRLGRTVAIKVLPAASAGDRELRQRFEREARTISSLNHPHICSLFDVGHQDGTDFLVMEYLEGETLAHRLQRGALSTEQLLQYGREIADALDKAHRQGIVHRDLKPGNIMLTKSGVKLMDFGLAKLAQVAAPMTTVLSQLVTEDQKLTDRGIVVGTFQYMAPEVLEGKEADARADIFALGVVLYEMATGRPAFQGKTRASLIAAILSSEPPPIAQLQPLTPPALERVVKACLAKDPEERIQTAHDVLLQLKWIAEAGSEAGVPVPVAARRKRRERIAWGCAAALALLAIALGVGYVRRAPAVPAVVRFSLPPPENAHFDQFDLALSPDGRSLAAIGVEDSGKRFLWVRSLDSLAGQRPEGTEGAQAPFWSPDGKWVGFFADGKLKRVSVLGGLPETVCDHIIAASATWNREGVFLLTSMEGGPILRITSEDCAPKPATKFDPGGKVFLHAWPNFLPDGKHFLFTALARDKIHEVLVGSLDSVEARPLLRDASNAYYSAPGYLLFSRQGILMTQPFDAQSQRLSGEAIPLVKEQLHFVGLHGGAAYSASENGVLAYFIQNPDHTQLVWRDRSGKQLGVIPDSTDYVQPRLSPDGTRVVAGSYDWLTHTGDLWTYDLQRNHWQRLTQHSFPASATAVWSHDGSHIYYDTMVGGKGGIYAKPARASGEEETLFTGATSRVLLATDVSPDGRYLLFGRDSRETGMDILRLPLSGEHKPTPLRETKFNESYARFSPDGHWIVYASDESGQFEVYLQPFSGSGEGTQISSGGGRWPVWRRDGKELFYLNLDRQLMAVSVQLGLKLQTGTPRALFPLPRNFAFDNGFDATEDGRQLLIPEPTQSEPPSMTLVLNWPAGLKK